MTIFAILGCKDKKIGRLKLKDVLRHKSPSS